VSTDTPAPRTGPDIPPELVDLCRKGRPQVVAVRARAGPERFALTTSLLQVVPLPGVVIASGSGAEAYRNWLARGESPLPGTWAVLEGGATEGGVLAVAHALASADRLIVEPKGEDSVAALWLPGHILEAFGLLPPSGEGIVVIDSWDDLLGEYLGADAAAVRTLPTVERLESILVDTLRTYAHATVFVLVDSASRSRILDLADRIVEVAVRSQSGLLTGSILVTGKGGPSGRPQPIGFHLEGGSIRWHPSG
jgi:hypothetical protein